MDQRYRGRSKEKFMRFVCYALILLENFSVVSYNVLADALVREHITLYPNLTQKELQWSSRSPRLIR